MSRSFLRRRLFSALLALCLPLADALAQRRALSVDQFEELLDRGIGGRAAARVLMQNCWRWRLTPAEIRFLASRESLASDVMVQIRGACAQDTTQSRRAVNGQLALSDLQLFRARVIHRTVQERADLEWADTLVAGVDRMLIGELRMVGHDRGPPVPPARQKDTVSMLASDNPVAVLFQQTVGAEQPTCVMGADTASITRSALQLVSSERGVNRVRFVLALPDSAPPLLTVRCAWKNAQLSRSVVVRAPQTTDERRAQSTRVQLCSPSTCWWGVNLASPAEVPISADTVVTAQGDGSRHFSIRVTAPPLRVRLINSTQPSAFDLSQTFRPSCYLTPMWGGTFIDEITAFGGGDMLAGLSAYSDSGEPFRYLEVPLTRERGLHYLLAKSLEDREGLGFMVSCDLGGSFATGSILWVAAVAGGKQP